MHRSLLGLILERESILTRNQVLMILKAQKEARDQGRGIVPFGQMALEMKLVTPRQLQTALALQAKLAVAPGEKKRLGFYLLEAGMVTPTQLLGALREQGESGGKLGEILVRQGWISDSMLEMFLAEQAEETAARTQQAGDVTETA